MTIQNDHHVFVAGITGGGKSFWIKNYAATRHRVLKLDTKQEALIELRDGINPWAQVSPKKLAILEKFDDLEKHDWRERPYVIYVPSLEDMDDPEFFNEFFRWSFLTNRDPKNPFINWIDELKDVVPNAHTIPKYLKYLYTKGRFFNNTVWGASQEPRHLHSVCLSQPTHFVAFDLPRIEDRKRLADNTGAPEFTELPSGYNFWYFRRGWRNAVKGVIAE